MTTGYTQLTKEVAAGRKKRIICSLSGQEKTGKTDWILRTAPEPVWYNIFDPNGEKIAEKMVIQKGRDIRIAKYSRRPDGSPIGDYVAEWAGFMGNWAAALREGKGTILVDTGTEMYESIRLAHFGKLTQVLPHHYGPVNAALKGMMRDAYDSDLSIVFIHKMRKEYQDEKWTGGYSPAGWNDMAFQVQCNLEAWRDDQAIPSWNPNGQGYADQGGKWVWPFHILVRDCNLNMQLAGQDITTDMIGFGEFLEMVFTA